MADPAPVAEHAHGPELFAEHDTAALRKMHNALGTHIPGDATWAATVSRILQHLLSVNISNPARAERDKVAEEKRQAALKLVAEKTEAERKAKEAAVAKAAADAKPAFDPTATNMTPMADPSPMPPPPSFFEPKPQL